MFILYINYLCLKLHSEKCAHIV